MTKFVVAGLGIFALIAVLAIGGFYFFGLTGAVFGILLLAALVRLGFKLLQSQFLGLGKALLESKSRVLRGATTVVHSIKAAPAPKNYGIDKQLGQSTCFYFLDVTIAATALTHQAPCSSWDPHELTVIPFDAKAPDIEGYEPGEYGCEVHDISIITEGEIEEAEKSSALTRLRLHVEVPYRTDRLKFLYYFETFGDLQIS